MIEPFEKEIRMILVDFSAIMFQCVFASPNVGEIDTEIDGKYDTKKLKPIIISLILSSLFDYQEQNANYGPLTLCLDSKNNWRLDILRTYKSSRKSSRDETPFRFNEIFDIISELTTQLKENTPWKVIQVERAEADDIILTLANTFADKEDVLIISSDKDMIQAQKYHDNIKQFSPHKKEFMTFEDKAKLMSKWILEHTVLGDIADEVPKITDETEFSLAFKTYLESIKLDKLTPKMYHNLNESQKSKVLAKYTTLTKKGNLDIWANIKLGPKTLEKIINTQGLEAFLDSNELYRDNLERNKKLVLMEYIPEHIKNECINKYNEEKTFVIENFKKFLYDNNLVVLSSNLPQLFNEQIAKLEIDDLINGFF